MLYQNNIYKNIPLVKLLMFYILGILISIYFLNKYIVFGSAIIILTTLALAVKVNYNSKILVQAKLADLLQLFILISFLFLGYSNGFMYQEFQYKNHFTKSIDSSKYIKVKLAQTPVEKEKSFKAEAKIIALAENEKSINYTGKVLCYFEKDINLLALKVGDVLYINASLNSIDIARNPNEFNYKQYLFYKNISHQVYIPNNNWKLIEANEKLLTNILFKTKRKLQKIINENVFYEDERAVASALLLGNRNMLSDEILLSFSSTGATHILAVSGLHVGIFYGIISFSFLWLKRFKKLKILHPIIVILSIWFYVALTGGSPSVTRAATMFSFIAIGFALNRNINIYNIIAFSAFIITTFNPYIITDVGFQLSYFAVTGIIFLYDKIYTLIYVPWYFLDKIWSITAVSIAAQIATFPLIVLYFHQFPNLFFISNLIVIPAASFILYGGIIMFLLSWNDILLSYAGKALSYLIQLLNKSLSLIEQIPYALSTKLYISHLQAVLFYILIILLVMAFTYRNKDLLKYALLSILILAFTFSYNFIEKETQKELIVYHVPKLSAIEFINAHNAYSKFDSLLLNDENLINFRVEHNWWEKQIHQHHYNFEKVTQNYVAGNKVILVETKKIMLIDENYKEPNIEINVDYVIISHTPKMNFVKLSEHIKADTYIFDTSNDKYKEKYWKQDCESLGLNCYFVSDSVAFQIKL